MNGKEGRGVPRKGIFLNHADLEALGVAAKLGATFDSDRLDLFLSTYEVTEVTERGVFVKVIGRADPKVSA